MGAARHPYYTKTAAPLLTPNSLLVLSACFLNDTNHKLRNQWQVVPPVCVWAEQSQCKRTFGSMTVHPSGWTVLTSIRCMLLDPAAVRAIWADGSEARWVHITAAWAQFASKLLSQTLFVSLYRSTTRGNIVRSSREQLRRRSEYSSAVSSQVARRTGLRCMNHRPGAFHTTKSKSVREVAWATSHTGAMVWNRRVGASRVTREAYPEGLSAARILHTALLQI